MLKGRLQRALTAFAPEGDVGRRVLHGLVGVAGVGIVHRFLGLAVALVLARHLGTYTYGQYAFATSLAALLGVVATFGIPPVAMREIARHDGRGDAARLAGQVRASWRMAFIAVALALALGVPLVWLGGGLAAFDLTTYLVALMLVPLGAALTLLCAVLQGLRKAVESSLPGQVVQPVAMLLALFGMVLLLGMKLNAAQAMVVNVATTAFALIFAWARVRRHYPLAASEATPVEPQGQWRVVLPFVMLAGLSFINGRMDVIMLGAMATPDEVGLYRVAFQGAQLVGFPLLAIGSAFAPEVARLGRDAGRDALSRLMGMGAILTGLGALLAFLGALLLGRWGIALVLGEVYLPAWAPMMVLAAGHLVSGMFGPVGLLLNMQGHEKRTLAAGMFAAIANVALNALLIPRYGMMGAAFATSASLIAWNLALGISLRRAAGVLPGPLALLEVGRATR